jgi:glycosyltransferase involved in cell wall biosynthesis
MRILRVINSMDPAQGGPSEGIRKISPLLRERGVETTVVCQDSADAPWLSNDSAMQTVALGKGRGPLAHNPELLPWLTEHLCSFDAVVAHGVWLSPNYALWAARRAKMASGKVPPYFLYCHGMMDPWFNRTFPLKRFKKQLYWWWREYAVFRDAAAVCFTTEEEKRLARQSFLPYRVRERVVPYGTVAPIEIDLQAAEGAFRNRAGLGPQQPYLLFLGRLHPKKGLDTLLRAWNHFIAGVDAEKTLSLALAGPCDDSAYLEALKILAGQEWGRSVIRVDHLGGEMKWGALAGARAMILPSHQENFGMVVAESLAVGTPVLLTRPVNTWREVLEAKAGWVEEDTEDGVLRLLQKQSSAAPSTWHDLRLRARLCFKKHFDLTTGADAVVEMLREREPEAEKLKS